MYNYNSGGNMKNSRDKSIIQLIFALIIYYLISIYFPGIININNKLLKNFIGDILITVAICCIYYKDLKKGFAQFKKSEHKYKYIIWAIGIYLAILGINILVAKYYPSLANAYYNDRNRALTNELITKYHLYGAFKLLLYTPIVESILFSLSLRKVIKNNVIFIIIASSLYTYFNYAFAGLESINLLGSLFIWFIPRCLYNYSYYKNNNNIFVLIFIVFILNLIPLIFTLLG